MEKLLRQKQILEKKMEECKNTTGMLIPMLFKLKYQKEYDEIIIKINKNKNEDWEIDASKMLIEDIIEILVKYPTCDLGAEDDTICILDHTGKILKKIKLLG